MGAIFGEGELLRGVLRGLPVGVLRSALHVIDGLTGQLEWNAQLHQSLDLALVGEDAVGGSRDGAQVAGGDCRQSDASRRGKVHDPASGQIAL